MAKTQKTNECTDTIDTKEIIDMKTKNKKSKRKLSRKKLLKRRIAASVFLICLIALYCLACSMLKDHVIWKNVTVNGISLKGLTKKAAADALAENFKETYADKALSVRLNNQTYTINISAVLDFDPSKEIKDAYSLGHRHWLMRGIDWVLAHTLYRENEKTDAYPYAKQPDKLKEAITASGLPDHDPAGETTWELTDTALVVHKGQKTISADLDALQALMISSIEKHDYSSIIECPVKEKEPHETDFSKIHEEIYQEKQNATLDKENNYAVIPSKNGISFDTAAAQSSYDACEPGGQFEVPLIIDEADITTEDMNENLFQAELASYSTNGGGSAGRRANIDLAVKACDGIILLPGETFSYNDVLGERTAERGYQPAGAYSEGEVVEQLGGGICQVSSTLFAALLHTDLEIVTRSNHSMPVSYLPMGMDATVSWGGPEFKFKNNLTYPIKLSATYSGGTITFKILGAKTDVRKIEVEVKKISELSVETYRKYYDADGNVTETKRVAKSNYKPLNH